jgi:hypothetical protein
VGSCYFPSARFYVVQIYADVNSRITKKKAGSPIDRPGSGDGGAAVTRT